MGGKELRENILEFCNKLNIKFCLVLDRDVVIEIEELIKCIKKIGFGYLSYNRFEGGFVLDFFVDFNGFEVFFIDLVIKEKYLFGEMGI